MQKYIYRKGIINVIYWKLHTNFLLNYQEESKRFLSMLEDEISLAPHGSLIAELGPIHVERYHKIKERMKLGLYTRLFGDGASSFANQWCPHKNKELKEKDFCKKLCKKEGRKFLFTLLGIPNDAFIIDEFDMGIYGRCDIVIQSNRTRWLIEVKMGIAPDSVVSQIDKYRLSEELQMCLGLHDKVKPFVLSSSFSNYTINELSRNGIGMLLHDGSPESLRTMTFGEHKESQKWTQEHIIDPTLIW